MTSGRIIMREWLTDALSSLGGDITMTYTVRVTP